MTQLKVLALLLITSASLNIKAETMSAYLDLSHLYQNTYAGQYFIGLALNPKDAASVEVTQHLADAPGGDMSDRAPQVCLTEFKVKAGSLSLILTDANTDKNLTVTQNMDLYSGNYDDSEKCSSVDSILAKGISFSPYFYLGSFTMNYRAPKDFQKIITSLTLFPYGYSVSLQITKDGGYSVQNLKNQLSAQLKRGNTQGLSYSTYAENEESSLALGSGYIELK